MIAVVTDVKYRMSLALIRDLGQEGVSVIACHGGEGRPFAFSSRYVSSAAVLPDPVQRPEAYLDALYALCAGVSGGRPVLLPVGAATLALLCRPETRRRFQQAADFLLPTQEALDLANDKSRLARLAVKLGVPTPRSFSMEGEGDFQNLPYPVVVKPVCGEKQGLTARQRYVIARDPETARTAYASFTFDGTPPVVQEYLEGEGYGLSVLAKDGEIVDFICHRRIREYPLSGGPSTCCMTVDAGPLLGYAQALIRALDYSGVGMIEFKGDGQGGYRLLEMNPRVWGTFPLVRVSGGSLGKDWARLAAGRAPLRQAARLGARMYFFPSDGARCLAALRAGRGREIPAALGDWISPKSREGVFEWSDARASAAYLLSYVKRGAK